MVLAAQLGLRTIDLNRHEIDNEAAERLPGRARTRAPSHPGRSTGRAHLRRLLPTRSSKRLETAAHRSARSAGGLLIAADDEMAVGARPRLQHERRRSTAPSATSRTAPAPVASSSPTRPSRRHRGRRERARRQGPQRDPRAGSSRPCLRRPHRTAGRRIAGPGSHRRRAPRAHEAPRGHGRSARVTGEGARQHEHRRAPPAAGRSVAGHRGRPRPRRPRRDLVDGVRRDVRHATPRQDARLLQALRARHARRHLRVVRRAHPIALRHGRVRGPDRLGQDDHPLRHPRRRQRRRDEGDDDRGPGRVRHPVDQPDADQRAGRRDVRDPGCEPSSARTRTRSSSARSATSRPRASPCRPRSRATSSCRRCTRPTPAPRCTGSSTWASSRSCSRRRCSASSASGSSVGTACTASRSYTPTVEEIAFFERCGGKIEDAEFQRGAGCNFCGHTGYFERVGVYEVLRRHRRAPRTDRAGRGAHGRSVRSPKSRA